MKETGTLIILPGWGGSHETWAPFVSRVEACGIDVHVIDLPCFGDEPCPSEVWGVSQYADFVQQKIQALGTDHVTLMGHSFGGAVAVNLIGRGLVMPESLILVGAAIVRPKNYVKRFFGFLFARWWHLLFQYVFSVHYQEKLERFFYRLFRSPDYKKTSGIQRDIFRKIVREDQQTYLPKIEVPTTVVWGARDKMTPLRFGKKILAQLPDATMTVAQEGRHGLHHTHQDLLLHVVEQHLSYD